MTEQIERRMAEESGLDLGALTPSTAGAAVNRADVEAALLARQNAALAEGVGPAPAGRKVALSPTRLTIARRMRQSLDAAAPVTYMSEVDATRLVKLRKHILQLLPEGAARPTYTDFLVYLTCRALAKFPQMNATFDGTTLETYEQVHMGLAVDTERGLLVPVLRDAESLGIAGLAEKRSALVRKAQEGSLAADELSGGTFTLTNLGTMGIDHFTPIINPPQVAILGMGRIREVVVVRKKKIRRRYVMGLAVTADHRVIDGAPAARFLQELCRLVEEPGLVLLK
jgi:pyruvate dehydrogenase E2 component (dihydrolipoamide acetyltransferase)